MAPVRATDWYAWYAVAVLTLANVSALVDMQILNLLVLPIRRDLGISDTQFSYLSGLAFAIFYSLLGIPIARLADRANRRNVMTAGIALWSVFTTLCATAQTYGRLFVMRIGVGFGEAALNAPSVSLLADAFPREQLGRAMSIFSLGVFLGAGAAYAIGGWVVGLASTSGMWTVPIIGQIHPWQSVFLVVGVPGVLIALLMLTVREPARTQPLATRLPFAAVLAYMRRNRRTFVSYILGFTMSGLVNWALSVWLNQFFVRTYDWTPARAGSVQGILTMTIGTIGVVSGGFLSDWFVRRGQLDGPLRVGIIGAAGMLVAATAYPFMPSASSAVAWLAVVNLFAALPWGAAATAVAESVPAPLRAQVAALFFLAQGLISRVLGPSSVAWITDYGFHDPLMLRYSLAIVNLVGMSATILLFALGLSAYRATVTDRESWVP